MAAVQAVVSDVNLVARILSGLDATRDKHSAALVCRPWSEAMRWASHTLSIRHRKLLHKLVFNFCHVSQLNLAFRPLNDLDLFLVGKWFKSLKVLTLGSQWRRQESVTGKGLDYISLTCSLLESISLANLPKLRDEGIEVLVQNCRQVKTLSLESCEGLTDRCLELLQGWSSTLQSISLIGELKFSSEGLCNVSACKELLTVKLDLGYVEIDAALTALAGECSKLESVDLKFKAETHLEGLMRCTSLRVLTIFADQRRRLDAAIVQLADANRQLRELTFISSDRLLEESSVISIVKSCNRLKKLHLDKAFLTETALMSITLACRDLEHLGLGFDHLRVALVDDVHGFRPIRSPWSIRDVDIQHLVSKLKYLNLKGCRELSSSTFASIATCTKLQHLDLSFTKVDDSSLAEIAANVKGLTTLSLVRCQRLTSSCFVAQFSALENLNVEQARFVSDEGLHVIADGCPLLRSINLAFTGITDAGLAGLAKCTELRTLRISFCLAIRGEGLLAISSSCKWLQLVVLGLCFKNFEVVHILTSRYCLLQLEAYGLATEFLSRCA